MSHFGCVLDLDDTLYLERDYVRSGFRAVASLAGSTDGGPTPAEVEDFLWSGFVDGSRGSAFDDLFARYPNLTGAYSIGDLVTAYREHAPTIEMLPGMADLVEDLAARGVALAVISDGAEASQGAKARALQVARFADPVVLTDSWGREWWKPHPRAYEFVAERLGLPPERLVYVGDNPTKDFVSPARLGWSAIRLRLPDQLHTALDVSEPGVLEARSVEELHEQLVGLAESYRPKGTPR